MAKLYFSYAAMNAGKSTGLLQVAHNYTERDMRAYLLTAKLDDRAGEGQIGSRIGLSKPAETYTEHDNLLKKVTATHATEPIGCVLVDEAQWLTTKQVWELSDVADKLRIPVMTYGLRTDFQGKLFPGSEALLAIADELREIRTICHCGRKAIMVLRKDEKGNPVGEGPQTLVGGNETYTSLCRSCWKEALGK